MKKKSPGEIELYGLVDYEDRHSAAELAKSNDLGNRDNKGKVELSYNMVGKESNEGMARVWMFGSTKYGRANWLKGFKWSAIMDSLLRHENAFMSGEDIDPESGLPHVDHMQANTKILSQMFHTRKDLDDRTEDQN